jgi:hypothetical protein
MVKYHSIMLFVRDQIADIKGKKNEFLCTGMKTFSYMVTHLTKPSVIVLAYFYVKLEEMKRSLNYSFSQM